MKITESPYPIKTYSSCSPSNDWFNSVQKCLQWNVRKRQKSFVIVEGGADMKQETESNSSFACIRPNNSSSAAKEDHQEDQDDSSSETFDLDAWTEEELARD